MPISLRHWFLAGTAIAAAGLGSPHAVAQQAQPADGAAPQVEEIVVVAQRRAEKLQDVPVAITALSNERIKQTALRSLTDLQYLASSVQYDVYNGGGFQIRGVGTQSFDYGSDQTVGIMIDGVVQGIPRDPGLNSLTDIDHVEVLRGPQGTLFGKNTSAGLINIITKKPVKGRWLVDGHVTYGSDNESVNQLNANIPLGPTLAARASFYLQHRDGFLRNVMTNTDLDGTNDMGFRGKLLWQPTDDLDVYLIGAYERTRDTRNAQTLRVYGPGPGHTTGYPGVVGIPYVSPAAQNAPYGIVAGPDNEKVADLASPGNRYRVHGVSGEINYHFGDYTVTSVTGYRVFDGNQDYISDAVPPLTLDHNRQTEHANQLTQELRLASPTGGLIDYVVGLYYFRSDIAASQIQAGTFNLPNFQDFHLPYGPIYSQVGGIALFHDHDTSYAAFGQGTLHATDELRFILGGRYTHDEVDSTFRAAPYGGITPVPFGKLTPPGAANVTHDNVSFHVGMQYDFTPDIMAYATFATGYKGPTVSNIQGEARPIKPETSDDFELGVKSTLFERRLTLNVAAFYEKYHDFQAQVFDHTVTPAQFTLGNAGGLRSKGFEVDFDGRITQELSISGGATYAYATYTDFTSQCYTGQPISGVPGAGCYLDPATKSYAANLAGYPVNVAPKWSIVANVNYSHPVFDGYVFDANANFVWKSDVFTIVPDPNTRIRSYGLLGVNLGVSPEDSRWRLGFFVRNLLDQHFVDTILPNFFDAGGYGQSPAVEARRTIGMMLDFKFGGDAAAEPETAPAVYVPPPVQTPAAAPRSYLVFFDFARSDLTAQAKAIVDAAARNASAAKASQLAVTGHTDTVGSDAYNIRLSRRRAESVAAELERQGVPAAEIAIVARGKRDLLVPTADGVREPQNRRVQIVF